MRIGIVGWGVEGQSAFNYFGPEHEYLIVNEHPPHDELPAESDKIKIQYLKSDKPAGITGNVTDLSYLDDLEQCDRIIYSPTARKNLEKKFGVNQEFWAKATTERHIFFETVKTKNIIGVTGTKGKGTTSTLIFQMLQAAGKRSYLGGNIGRSVLDFVKDVSPDDWVVLELSNFQLYKFPYSPRIAVCLMITPEHLDWHPNLEDYIEAKANIFTHQKAEDTAIYFDANEYSRQLAYRSAGVKIPFFQTPGARVREDGKIVITESDAEIIHKDEIKLLGEHNLQNVCAAITAVWFGLKDTEDHVKTEAIRQVLTTFTGLEHRLEFVRELEGVMYYDDTFSTNPSTTIVALNSFKQPKVIVLGGIDKGLSFEEMTSEVVKSNVRHAIVIGTVAEKIARLLRDKGFNSITTDLKTMQEIVKKAKEVAQPGDIVLLSPGSSSFDMFENYKVRGEQFKQAVQELV
jgi:UDP-N-acetylmuramoylalanine--D-glutamate ligase